MRIAHENVQKTLLLDTTARAVSVVFVVSTCGLQSKCYNNADRT